MSAFSEFTVRIHDNPHRFGLQRYCMTLKYPNNTAQIRSSLKIPGIGIYGYGFICCSPNRNLARSGFWLGQIGIRIWLRQFHLWLNYFIYISMFSPNKNSFLARQIPDLARPNRNLDVLSIMHHWQGVS